jgi:hypothetical protein
MALHTRGASASRRDDRTAGSTSAPRAPTFRARMRHRLLTLSLALSCLPGVAYADAFTESLVLETRAFDVPRGAPTLVAHAGPAFDPTRPFTVVLFLHGWSGCANVLVREGAVPCAPGGRPDSGWDLAGAFDRANENALLLVPQLAYRMRDGSPGNLARLGAARRMIDEALVALGARVAGKRIADVTRVVVVAHSAGFMTALAVMRRGGLDDLIDRVVLMDALYDVPSAFFMWLRARPTRSIVSFHTSDPRTTRNNAALATFARREMPDGVEVDPTDRVDAIARARLVVSRTDAGHSAVPSRHLAEVIGARTP